MITFSDKAVEKVNEFAAQMSEAEGKELRIFIQGVGCSGFSYGFTFDEQRDGDSVVENTRSSSTPIQRLT
jgi:iron-sulfur cluster insertion protein